MKGLLLKDIYMMKHYCKSYILIAVVFFAVSLFNSGNLFFAFYPCLLCGMIPLNLLSYDERSRFLQYSASLPYTRSQIVSEKYLLGLLVQAVVIAFIGIAQGIKMRMEGSFALGDFGVMLLSALLISTLSSSIPMPFVFKHGVEKGRIAYYVMIGFVCAASVFLADLFKGGLPGELSSGLLFTAISAAAVIVYILSWYLSVCYYKKREL